MNLRQKLGIAYFYGATLPTCMSDIVTDTFDAQFHYEIAHQTCLLQCHS